ncbi:MAG: hypothetical protein IPL92_16680 [Saprospiraceae bacterium]|nr:hypothetical protein [Candidatus Opimibacter iunctus]
MNRFFHFLVGPELLWLCFYLLVLVIIKASGSPVKSMDGFWESTAWFVPLLLIPLTFMLYYAPGVIRDWMLLRIWIVGLVGGHYVLSKSLAAYTEQGPGIGTAYIMGMGLLFFLLIAGSIWAKLKF